MTLFIFNQHLIDVSRLSVAQCAAFSRFLSFGEAS